MTAEEDLMLGKGTFLSNARVLISIGAILIGGGFWVGVTVMSIKSDVQTMKDRQLALVEKNVEQDQIETSNTARIRALEQTAARSGAQYDALFQSMADIKQQINLNNQLVRQILQQMATNTYNGNKGGSQP